MKWNDKAPAAENIRRSLPKRLRKYAAAGHATFQSKKDWDAVHDFRIQSKRMRYTLELFTEYFGPRYVELIDRVRHLQTLLGDINDLVTARRLLKGREDAVDVRERFRDTAHKKLSRRTGTGNMSLAMKLWSAGLVICRRKLAANQSKKRAHDRIELFPLGRRLTVRLQTLDLRIGVRIPASQPHSPCLPTTCFHRL